MRRRGHRLGLTVALLLGIASLSSAQSFGASVVGMVTDSSGAVLPGTAITIREINTGQIRETVSDRTGAFSVPQLPPGLYEMASVDAMTAKTKGNVRCMDALVVDRAYYYGICSH